MIRRALCLAAVLALIAAGAAGQSRSGRSSRSGSGSSGYGGSGYVRSTSAPSRPSASAASPASVPAQSAWDNYRVLASRNMFSRDRTPRIAGSRPSFQRTEFTRSEPASPTLTGVIERDGKFEAFFEDPASGRTSRLAAGAALGRGRIADVSIDHVTYIVDGASRRILVGQDLSGESSPVQAPSGAAPPLASAAVAGTAASGPAGSAVSQPASTVAGDGSPESILERMRRRAAEERKP